MVPKNFICRYKKTSIQIKPEVSDDKETPTERGFPVVDITFHNNVTYNNVQFYVN